MDARLLLHFHLFKTCVVYTMLAGHSCLHCSNSVFRITFLSLSGSIPVVRSGMGSPPNRSIFLDNVVCTGGESNLTECGHSTISNCDRSEEAGVRCEGML